MIPITAVRISGNKSTLIGKWKWFSGVEVSVMPDGIVTAGLLKGSWRKSGSTWLITWPLEDIIFMAKDGQNLSISNQFGVATASRDESYKY